MLRIYVQTQRSKNFSNQIKHQSTTMTITHLLALFLSIYNDLIPPISLQIKIHKIQPAPLHLGTTKPCALAQGFCPKIDTCTLTQLLSNLIASVSSQTQF